MARRILKKYSNVKIKRFLFFLVLASVLWVLTKFGREFSAPMEAKIEYYNLPETAVLSKENTDQLHFDLTANGFEILFYKFKKPVLEIDVENYYKKGVENFSVTKEDLLQKLEIKFNKYFEIRNLKPDPLEVKLDPIVLKKVVVIPDTDIEFKKGFRSLGEVVIDPKEITISGPKAVLAEIDTVYTERYAAKRVDKNIGETIAIKSPSDEIVAITPEEISFSMDVSEFSEGKYKLPVEVINLPPGVELKLVPSNLTLTFDMAITDFRSISPENFRVVCDYSKRNQEDNFMIPELIKQPKEAENVMINPKKIEFYVFK